MPFTEQGTLLKDFLPAYNYLSMLSNPSFAIFYIFCPGKERDLYRNIDVTSYCHSAFSNK